MSVQTFWNTYFELLRATGISPRQHKYYMDYVKRFIAAKGPVRLNEVTPDFLHDYLDQLRMHPTYPAWRLEETARALELLFTQLVQAPWAADFGWDQKLRLQAS